MQSSVFDIGAALATMGRDSVEGENRVMWVVFGEGHSHGQYALETATLITRPFGMNGFACKFIGWSMGGEKEWVKREILGWQQAALLQEWIWVICDMGVGFEESYWIGTEFLKGLPVWGNQRKHAIPTIQRLATSWKRRLMPLRGIVMEYTCPGIRGVGCSWLSRCVRLSTPLEASIDTPV